MSCLGFDFIAFEYGLVMFVLFSVDWLVLFYDGGNKF